MRKLNADWREAAQKTLCFTAAWTERQSQGMSGIFNDGVLHPLWKHVTNTGSTVLNVVHSVPNWRQGTLHYILFLCIVVIESSQNILTDPNTSKLVLSLESSGSLLELSGSRTLGALTDCCPRGGSLLEEILFGFPLLMISPFHAGNLLLFFWLNSNTEACEKSWIYTFYIKYYFMSPNTASSTTSPILISVILPFWRKKLKQLSPKKK